MVIGDIVTIPHDERPSRLLAGIVAVVALGLGLFLGSGQDPYRFVAFAGAIVTITFFLTRRTELIGALTVATAILVDYYQLFTLPVYFPAVATVIGGLAVLFCYTHQTTERTWTRTPYLWIWALILLLDAIQIPVSVSLGGAIHYYVDVIFNAVLAYVLGVQIGGGGGRRLRTLLIALAGLAVFIAAHGIIQAQAGEFLFVTPTWASWLAYKANYTLFGTNTIRAGSFLILSLIHI